MHKNIKDFAILHDKDGCGFNVYTVSTRCMRVFRKGAL